MNGTRCAAVAVAIALGLSSCGTAEIEVPLARAATVDTSTTVTTPRSTAAATPTSTTTTEPVAIVAEMTTTTASAPTTAAATTTTARPRPTSRSIVEQPYTPMATFADVVVHHPSTRVEIIGWHESGHDGARQLEPASSARPNVTMESRDRGTGSRTAADIAVDPASEVRAPVTGTVARSGTYTLYCDHTDEFVVINPDAAPSWELKVFHIVGVGVRKGDRVEAGVTSIAQHSRQLPFESQVDEYTAEPSWPHVHVELVDPSIPDRPSGGGCP